MVGKGYGGDGYGGVWVAGLSSSVYTLSPYTLALGAVRPTRRSDDAARRVPAAGARDSSIPVMPGQVKAR